MATSRSASAAARLSSSAVFSLPGVRHRPPSSTHFIRHRPIDPLRSCCSYPIVRPRALMSPNSGNISSSTLFSASCLNRVASPPSLPLLSRVHDEHYQAEELMNKIEKCYRPSHAFPQ